LLLWVSLSLFIFLPLVTGTWEQQLTFASRALCIYKIVSLLALDSQCLLLCMINVDAICSGGKQGRRVTSAEKMRWSISTERKTSQYNNLCAYIALRRTRNISSQKAAAKKLRARGNASLRLQLTTSRRILSGTRKNRMHGVQVAWVFRRNEKKCFCLLLHLHSGRLFPHFNFKIFQIQGSYCVSF
jgi:predicted Fe-S protein YdhL (DUF1289 family)